MNVVSERCAGIDVHKKSLTVCFVASQEHGEVSKEVQVFPTNTCGLLALDEWLREREVTAVAMESTGVYWRPVYTILEDGRDLVLVNPQHYHGIRGKKTDRGDAAFLADLVRHGLVRGSFVPPTPVREVRELVRYRKSLVAERTREVNRVHKVLETANIKLTSVVSDVLGVTGRAILEALIAGETDPLVLADLACGRLRDKRPALRQALDGRVTEHHRRMLALAMEHITLLEQLIGRVEQQIEACLLPFQDAVALLLTIPGVSAGTAAVIVGEIGTDMRRFPSHEHLASWAGMCPGNHISADTRKSGAPTGGDPWLRTALVQAAWAAVRHAQGYLATQYHRLCHRLGAQKAILAVAHSLLVIIYHMLRDKQPYRDLGADYLQQIDLVKVKDRYVKHLEDLGFAVTLTPKEAA